MRDYANGGRVTELCSHMERDGSTRRAKHTAWLHGATLHDYKMITACPRTATPQYEVVDRKMKTGWAWWTSEQKELQF